MWYSISPRMHQATNAAQDVYEQAFDSGELEYGEHTIRIEPTGLFGIDCIQYYTDLSHDEENREELAQAVAECSLLREENYDSGWIRFENALEDASLICTTGGYTQEDIDAALEELLAARDELVEYPEQELTELKAMIAGALGVIYTGDAKEYNPENFQGFNGALYNAIDTLNTRSASQETVDEKAVELQSSYESLISSEAPVDTETAEAKGGSSVIPVVAAAVVVVAVIVVLFILKRNKNKK